MFGKLQTNQEALNETSDRIFGAYQPLETNIYKATVVYAYGIISKGGAMGLVVKFNVDVGSDKPYPYTETFWVSNKKGDTFYLDENGKPHNLAGFNQANHLCSLITGSGLQELEAEEITIPLYNYEQKKDVPTTVNALTQLHDQDVAIALVKVRKNKQEKSPTTGEYEPVNEEIFVNEIDKVFAIKNGDCYTFDEVRNELEPEYATNWLERNEGKVRDKYKEVKGASTKAGTTRKLSIG